MPKDAIKVSLDLALIVSLDAAAPIGRAVILRVSVVSSKVMVVTTLFVASCTVRIPRSSLAECKRPLRRH